MKIKSVISIMIVTMLMISSATFAQRGPRGQQRGKNQIKKEMRYGDRIFNRIPNMTDAQKAQIKKLRTEMMKDMMPLKNKLQEKKAHLKTLATAVKPDMKAINKQIEEIGAIKIQMMKRRAKMHQDIRAILTDDQRIYFDMHFTIMGNNGQGYKKNGRMGSGCHRRNCGNNMNF